MDPILSTELAAAHRTELLRVAAARRRSATPSRYAPLNGLAARVRGLGAGLRRPVAAVPPPVACCA